MKTITVKTSYEGVHCWPEAPDEVSFLREPHRHMFVVSAEVEVTGSDREIEFIMLKRHIDKWLHIQMDADSNVWQMGRLSCEQVAEMVLDVVHEYCGDIMVDEQTVKVRGISVTVSEDGENGASVSNLAWNTSTNVTADAYIGGQSVGGAMDKWTMAEYQDKAYQNIQEHYNQKEEMMHWAIGLGEEAGEALSVVKHRYYAGCYKDDDDMLEDLVSELGDVLWHVSALCTVLGIGLEDVAKYNIAKLDSRYPNGKFERERSESRHEVYQQWKKETTHEDVMKQIREKRGTNR